MSKLPIGYPVFKAKTRRRRRKRRRRSRRILNRLRLLVECAIIWGKDYIPVEIICRDGLFFMHDLRLLYKKPQTNWLGFFNQGIVVLNEKRKKKKKEERRILPSY